MQLLLINAVYRIAGNFHELVNNMIFAEKTSWIASFCRAKGHHVPKFRRETSVNSHKTAKFAKVFFLESFLLYMVGS